MLMRCRCHFGKVKSS